MTDDYEKRTEMSRGTPSQAEIKDLQSVLSRRLHVSIRLDTEDINVFIVNAFIKATPNQVRKALEGSNWFMSIAYPTKDKAIMNYMFERVLGYRVKDLPRWTYHSTDPKNVPSILAEGLKPKRGKDWGYPARVYLASTIENAVIFADKKTLLEVLLIDTKAANVPMYHDEQFPIPKKGANSIYTNKPIPKEAVIGSLGRIHPWDLEDL